MGPTPLALGPYQFAALGFHMTDLTRNLQTPWSELKTAMRFDAAHWTGPTADSVTISGVLFPEEFGGQASLAGLAASAKAGRPLMLAVGSGDIGGHYRIEGISEDWSLLDAGGRPRRDAYKIELKRYAPSAIGGGLFGALSSLIGAATGGLGGLVGNLGNIGGLVGNLGNIGGLVGNLGNLGNIGGPVGNLGIANLGGVMGALNATTGALHKATGLITVGAVVKGVGAREIAQIANRVGVVNFGGRA